MIKALGGIEAAHRRQGMANTRRRRRGVRRSKMFLRPFVLGRKRTLALCKLLHRLGIHAKALIPCVAPCVRHLLTRVQLRPANARGQEGCFVSQVGSDEQDGVDLFDAYWRVEETVRAHIHAVQAVPPGLSS
jgi:hypothetical protein